MTLFDDLYALSRHLLWVEFPPKHKFDIVFFFDLFRGEPEQNGY